MRSNRSNNTPNDLRAIRSASGDGAESYSDHGLLPELTIAEEPKRTYRKSKRKRKKAKVHWWKSHPDAFEGDWVQITSWLDETPYLAATIILDRLQVAHPLKYENNKLRTLQRRVKAWRLEQLHRPKHEFSSGDSLPDASTIELVVHCENQSGNESVR